MCAGIQQSMGKREVGCGRTQYDMDGETAGRRIYMADLKEIEEQSAQAVSEL